MFFHLFFHFKTGHRRDLKNGGLRVLLFCTLILINCLHFWYLFLKSYYRGVLGSFGCFRYRTNSSFVLWRIVEIFRVSHGSSGGCSAVILWCIYRSLVTPHYSALCVGLQTRPCIVFSKILDIQIGVDRPVFFNLFWFTAPFKA